MCTLHIFPSTGQVYYAHRHRIMRQYARGFQFPFTLYPLHRNKHFWNFLFFRFPYRQKSVCHFLDSALWHRAKEHAAWIAPPSARWTYGSHRTLW